MNDILKKPTGQIRLPPNEVAQDSEKMLKHSLEIFKAIKEGQIRKQKMAAIVMEKAYERYGQIKQDQLQQLDTILKAKDEMEENLERLSIKCEDVLERSIQLSSRVSDFSSSVLSSNKLSKAEQLMKNQLQRIEKSIIFYQDSLRQLESRHEYVNSKIKTSLTTTPNVVLDSSQIESLSKSLDKQSDLIFDLVERVNRIKLKLN